MGEFSISTAWTELFYAAVEELIGVTVTNYRSPWDCQLSNQWTFWFICLLVLSIPSCHLDEVLAGSRTCLVSLIVP